MPTLSMKISQLTRCLCVLLVALGFGMSPAIASNPSIEPKTEREWKDFVNGGTVRILTKGLGCTCTVIASDMANVLNETGELRVLPVIGHGSMQGIADVMYLRGIDLSILQADVLAFVERNGIHQNIKRQMRYVTKLYNSELHLIAARHIKTIQDLDGKLVSYDVEGRGSFITAENVFDSLGIDPVPVHHERDIAIEKVKNGEIAAAFVVTGKPASSVRKITDDDRLHILPVPLTSDIRETYLPSSLTHDDYPELIEAGSSVETISVPEVLAVYNWPQDHERYAKVEAFVNAFFTNFEQFSDDVRHPKWKDVDITADLPGWQRFKPAQDWLDQRQRENQSVNVADGTPDGPSDLGTIELRIGDQVISVNNDRIQRVGKVEPVKAVGPSERAESFPSGPVDSSSTSSDTPILIDVAPAISLESDAELAFGITLSKAAEAELAIAYQTRDGTAEADQDFKDRNGVILIEPGVTEAKVNIELINDQVREGDEQFFLVMATDPSVAEFGQVKYPATINDDDS